jgi:putative cell wall-binding protein
MTLRRRALAAGAVASLAGLAFGGVPASAAESSVPASADGLEELKADAPALNRPTARPELTPQERVEIAAEIAENAPDQLTKAGAFGELARSGAATAQAAAHSFDFSLLFAGADRYETTMYASWLSGLGDWDDSGTINDDEDAAPVVYVVNGLNFPDALSAAAPAAYNGGVLLSTKTDTLPESTSYELQRLHPEKIVLVGGTSAISTRVANQIGGLTDATVQRQGGSTRYETSRIVAQSGYPDGAVSSFAYVASGVNFPDALAAGAPAALFGVPVVLVDGRKTTVDAATLALFDDLGVEGAEIAGGTSSVSGGIESQLRTRYGADGVLRSGGATRYETAAQLVENSHGYLYDVSREDTDPVNWEVFEAYFASGRSYPDALAGGAIAGYWLAPFYPVDDRCGAASAVQDSLTHLQPEDAYFLGGSLEELESDVFVNGTLPTC